MSNKLLSRSFFISCVILFLLGLFLVRELISDVHVWGDNAYISPSSTKLLVENFLYVWSSSTLGTSPRISFGNILPVFAVLSGLGDYGIYIFLRILPIFLLLFVVFLVTKKISNSLSIAIICSALSVANPVLLGDFKNGQTLWVYPIVYLTIYVIYKFVYLKETNLKTSIQIALLVFATYSLLPPIIVPFAFIIFLFSLPIILFEYNQRTSVLRLITFSSVSLVLCIFLLFPYLFSMPAGQGAYGSASVVADYLYNYSKTTLINTIRFAGNEGNGQWPLGYNVSSQSNYFGYLFLTLIIFALFLNEKNMNSFKYRYLMMFGTTTLLTIIGFLQILAVNQEFGAKLFTDYWLLATIRNPTKLYLLCLVIFLLIFAVTLSIIREKVGREKFVILQCFLVFSITVYSWPIIGGDLGLYFKSEKKKYVFNEEKYINILKIGDSNSRSVLIPADHDDELIYQLTNSSLNTLRLGGSYPKTGEAVFKLTEAYSQKLQEFKTVLNILGIKYVALKSPQEYENNAPFSLFRTKESYKDSIRYFETMVGFLSSKQGEYLIYDNQNASSLVSSSKSPCVLTELENFDQVTSLHEQGCDLVIEADGEIQINAKRYVFAKERLEGKESIAILRNPGLVEISGEIIDDPYIERKHIILYTTNIDRVSDQQTKIVDLYVPSNASLLQIDGKDIYLDNQSFKTNVRSGSHQVLIAKLQRVESASNRDDSFELENTIVDIGDADISRVGGEYSHEISNDSSEGSRSLLHKSRGRMMYSKTSLNIIDNRYNYILKFDYKNLSGLPLSFSVWQNGINSPAIFGDLDKNNKWDTATIQFKPSDNASSIDLYVYNNSLDSSESANLLDNISVFKIEELSYVSINIPSHKRSYAILPEENHIDIDNSEQSVNLLSTDMSEWRLGDATPNKDGVPIMSIKGIDSVSGRVLHLSSKNHLAYISQYVSSFDVNSMYKVSFDYIQKEGNIFSFAIWQARANISKPRQSFVANNELKHYETYFVPEKNASGMGIYFYVNGENGSESSVELSNVSIEKASPYGGYFYEDNSRNNEGVEKLEIINYERINPAKIIVTLKGKGVLKFNESFHPGWRAYYVGSPKELTHLKADYFANAWLIDQSSDSDHTSKIVIEFTPQRWFYVGLIISGTTLLACISYLGYDFIRSRRLKQREPPRTISHRY